MKNYLENPMDDVEAIVEKKEDSNVQAIIIEAREISWYGTSPRVRSKRHENPGKFNRISSKFKEDSRTGILFIKCYFGFDTVLDPNVG